MKFSLALHVFPSRYAPIGLARARSCSLQMSTASAKLPSNTKHILALDFDGVICASAMETAMSSVIAAEKHWKDDKENPMIRVSNNMELFEDITNAMIKLRPIIETGYENMLLVRLLLEEIQATGRDSNNKQIGSIDTPKIKSMWSPEFRDSLLAKYNCKKV